MVRDVKRVLQRGPCTLSQLAAELGASREIVRSALQFWLARGDIEVEAGRRESIGSAAAQCGSEPKRSTAAHCGPCASNLPERPGIGPAVYNWR